MAEKSTFTSIGMIMTQINSPTGILTLATSILPSTWNGAGKNWPSMMPVTIHSSTQTVR